MTTHDDGLVTIGSDAERVLTALGALHAYSQGDDDAVAIYPTLFSEGYLEFGFMGLATGIISSIPEHDAIIGDLSVSHFASSEEAQRLLNVAREILADSEYFVPTAPQRISPERWIALINVALAFLGRFAAHRGLLLNDVLNFIHSEMTKRTA